MPGSLLLHASAVSLGRRALLILGPSGAGKSALALELMALGAGLIADDRTQVRLHDGVPVASCPPAIRGRIEARGLGLLNAEAAPPAPVAGAVDLGKAEAERLPPLRQMLLLGVSIRLFHTPGSGHFPAALIQYLKAGAPE